MPRTAEDLTGRRFGMLTVTGYAGLQQQKRQKISAWNCVCDCGNTCVVPGYLLKQGRRKSCGCIRETGQGLVGKRFGKLTVESEDTQNRTTLHKVICRCDCGNRVSVATRDLKSGKTKDCGCVRAEKSGRKSDQNRIQRERTQERAADFHEGKLSGADILRVWCDAWIGAVLPNVIKETTIRMYTETLERHIIPFLGDVPLRELSPEVLDQWIKVLRKKPYAGRRVMTEGTLRNTFSILSGCLRDAQKAGLIEQNPCQNFNWDTKTKNLWEGREWLDESQIARLEPYLTAYRDEEGYPLGIAYELVLYTGLTISEAVVLRWEDVDLIGNRLFVRRFAVERRTMSDGGSESVYGIEAASGRRRREVPLPEKLCAKLSHIRRVYGGEEKDYIIHSENNMPVRLDRLRSALMRRGRNSGVGDVTPRMLRDSYAMKAVRAGATSDVLAELMGFASPQQVVRRYMPRMAEDKRTLVDRMFSENWSEHTAESQLTDESKKYISRNTY